MNNLNLLPPEEINKLEAKQFIGLLRNFSIWILFFLIIFIIFLSSIIFYFSIILKAQNELIEIRKNNERTQYLTEIEDKIKELNKNLIKIRLKQKEMIIWTPIIEELSEIIPTGIYLTDLSYQESLEKLSLRGIANTRENFLNFQDRLNKSSCFEEIEAPLSNLIKKNNVDFVFNIKMNDCSLLEDNN